MPGLHWVSTSLSLSAGDFLYLDKLVTDKTMAESRLQEFYDRIRRDLDRSVGFWRQYSRDGECG